MKCYHDNIRKTSSPQLKYLRNSPQVTRWDATRIIRPASFTRTHPVPNSNLMIRTPEPRGPWTTNTHSSLPVPPPEAHHSLIFVASSTFREQDHQNHCECYLEHLLGIFQLKGNARPGNTEMCSKSLESFVYESG